MSHVRHLIVITTAKMAAVAMEKGDWRRNVSEAIEIRETRPAVNRDSDGHVTALSRDEQQPVHK